MKAAEAIIPIESRLRPGRHEAFRKPIRTTPPVAPSTTWRFLEASHPHPAHSEAASNSAPAPKKPAATSSSSAHEAPSRANAASVAATAQRQTFRLFVTGTGAASPEPAMRLLGERDCSPRSVHQIQTAAVAMPPTNPIANDSGAISRRRNVVPTPSTHHVRRPYIIKAPYATAPATPIRLPRAERSIPSPRNNRRRSAAPNPIALRSPISRNRCSMPRRKKRLASSTAETTMKKLKEMK